MSVPVTVVVPVYNGERFVAEAIESVLGQRTPPTQVVIVDDGSTDGTRGVLAGFAGQVTVVSQENRGQSAARNAGILAATEPFVGFCDADDCWVPDKLERQLEALADQTFDAAFGHVREFTSAAADEAAASVRAPMRYVPGWLPSVMLVTRTGFDRVGAFDEGLRSGEFIEWLDRARAASLRTCMLDEVLVLRRIHGRNSSTAAGYSTDLAHAIKVSLDRRRGRA